MWQGLRLIRRHRISAIWSTYPIMSAHCIASTLSRLTGLPWIADFRDPVGSSVEAGNPYSVSSQKRSEQRVLARAQQVVFTTPGAMHGYAENYPAGIPRGPLGGDSEWLRRSGVFRASGTGGSPNLTCR